MFKADDVEVGVISNYQKAGVSEEVQITEFKVVDNSNGTKSIIFKTINENKQAGQSKRLSLNTVVAEGKATSGWKVSAKYLLNIIMSATGMSESDAKKVLDAASIDDLVHRLSNTLIGKSFRGLFSSREYQPGKYAIELYVTEPKGGTALVWDPKNTFYNQELPKPAENPFG